MDGKSIVERNNHLKSQAATWRTVWQDIADYVMPRKSEIEDRKTPDVEGWTDEIYDTTAIHANMALAAGQLNYLTPAGERWFSFASPVGSEGNDEDAGWMNEATTAVLEALARSNFYLEVHEMYLDRGAFGTSNLYVEESDDGGIRFKCHRAGTYHVSENHEGMVDTVFREFEMTARQAYQKFGEELPAKLLNLVKEGDPKGKDANFKFIHAVYPREDGDRDYSKQDGENKPIASVYVCLEENKIVQVGGYDSMPYFVSRYLKWGDECYGYGPSIEALPTIRQVNFIEKQLDALAEQAAFPRVLVPDSLEGEVDMRAAGITFFDPNNPAAMPKEWATQGRYDVGRDRCEQKRDSIRRSYHNDLFRMFAERDKQMTATEVLELAEEKLIQFSPTFARMVGEILDPMLERVFGLLYQQGKIPQPPRSLMVETDEGVGMQMPKIEYTSKIALAIKMMESRQFLAFTEVMGPLAQFKPEVLDAIDFDKATRGLARNFSLRNEWLRSEEDVDELREARAAAQQAMEQAEMAKTTAEAAKTASEVSPEGMNRMEGMFN